MGSLRKLKGALNRPIGLERRDGKLQVVLTERRKPRPADEAPAIALLCAELSARLLATAATMGGNVSEADVRKTTTIVRQLSDEAKGRMARQPRGAA